MIQETAGRKRPLGITIIAILLAIGGILGIISGITALAVSPTLAIINLVLGVAELVLAWGLWTLQRWAFWATVVVEALLLLYGVYVIVQGGIASGIVSVVIAAIILIYLFADRNVRVAFGT